MVADLDGDGRPDVATADAAGDALTVLRNAGAAAPQAALSAAFDGETVGRTGTARTITIADAATGAAPLGSRASRRPATRPTTS